MLGSFYNDYEIQDETLKKQYQEIVKNPLKFAQESYSTTLMGVLLQMKKVFQITPVALRENNSIKAKKLRNFTLYILVHYTDDMQQIVKQFGISQKELLEIQKDMTLAAKYKKKIEEFFSYNLQEKLANIYMGLCLRDDILHTLNSKYTKETNE